MFILRLKDIDYYPETEWTIGDVMAKRRVLLCDEPITSDKITRLDLWLARQPKLPLEVVGQVWSRMMLVSSMLYEMEKDPEQKHSLLLALREHFDEFKELPEKWQENMRPSWLGWLDTLRREELEACRGTA